MSTDIRSLPATASTTPPTRAFEVVAADATRTDGVALCLSGGGYRATVFHLGTLLRMNELGLLRRTKRVSSVSGGSITAGFLALRWNSLEWNGDVATNLMKQVVEPLMKYAQHTALAPSMLPGVVSSVLQGYAEGVFGGNDQGGVGKVVVQDLDKELFFGKTLQDLPDPSTGAPQFYINATNIKTGNLFVFSRAYMGEQEVGIVERPTLPVSVAVACSAAFPPFISPVRVAIDPTWQWKDYSQRPFAKKVKADDGKAPQDLVAAGCGLAELKEQHPKLYDTELKDHRTGYLFLGDGGIYDNTGLEAAINRFKFVIVSDAGANIMADKSPARDLFKHAMRVSELVDHQVRNLRKLQLVATFRTNDPAFQRRGCYLSIRGDIAKDTKTHELHPPALVGDFPMEQTAQLANVETTLSAFPEKLVQQLVAWGYARADAILRAYFLNLQENRDALHISANAVAAAAPVAPFGVSLKNVVVKSKL